MSTVSMIIGEPEVDRRKREYRHGEVLAWVKAHRTHGLKLDFLDVETVAACRIELRRQIADEMAHMPDASHVNPLRR